MNKKVLGIAIPYYKNADQCEFYFKKLMGKLNNQLTDDMLLYVYEDGQFSDWLFTYAKPNKIIHTSCNENKGVSWARNSAIDYLIDKVEYILFLDSDDDVDDDYLQKVYDYCADMTHEIIETSFSVNNTPSAFNPNVVRSGVAGSAIATKIIGKTRFDEKLQIGEDTKFMNEVCDLTKYRKKHCKTNYNYQYGINPVSLIKNYNNKRIKKERVN